MSRILLLNSPCRDGIAFVREGRCEIREDIKGTPFPCLTLAIMAGMLRRERHEVMLIDATAERISVEDIVEFAKWRHFEPDLIVFSTVTPTIRADCEAVGKLAAILNSPTLAFGAHCTALRETVLNDFPQLDAIIIGEPEEPVAELCRRLHKVGFVEAIAGIPSALYRCDGRVSGLGEPHFTKNLEYLAQPAWDLLNYKRYRIPVTNEPYFLVEVSRGCVRHCNFCTAPHLHGRKVRRRSVMHILEEINGYQKQFGVNWFYLWGDTALSDTEFIREFCEQVLKRRMSIHWFGNMRCDILNSELAKLMRNAGCWMLSLGIESASQETLDMMEKKITQVDIHSACAAAHSVGILILGFFILGYPGETVDDMQRTVNLALDLPIDYAQFAPATPYPGTPLWNHCVANGLLVTTDFERFEFSDYVINDGELNREVVLRVQRDAYRRFYLRPRIILRQIRFLRGFNMLRAAWERFTTWLGWCFER